MNERETLYASCLYDAAKENGCAKEVYEDLMLLAGIFEETPDYPLILNSYEIPFEKREALLDEALKDRVHVYTLNFLKILAKKRIAGIFAPCAKLYEKSYFEDNNIKRAKIVTALALDAEKRREVTKKIEESTGGKIISEFEVDPNLLGGMVIETDSSSIDASVRTRLDKIRRYIGKN